MKDKIERLSKGIFEYEQPEIVLSKNVLDLFVGVGKSEKDSFVIFNEAHTKMKGILYSSSKALKLEKTSFSGEENEIFFTVNSAGLSQGERIEGRIDIISDCGERQLPFTISVSVTTCQSSIGHIRNFLSFQSLAQASWQEAVELFDRKEFRKAVVEQDPRLCVAYDALCSTPNRNIALEQFLCFMKKKQECSFFVATSDINLEVYPDSYMEKIVITKNSWGYLKLGVEADQPFITLTKKSIDSNDFVNGRYELRFVSNLSEMKKGLHTANIRIFNESDEVRIPIRYMVNDREKTTVMSLKETKRTELRLLRLATSRACGNISSEEFIEEALRLTENVLLPLEREAGSNPLVTKEILKHLEVLRICKAYLYIRAGFRNRSDEYIAGVLLRKKHYEDTDAVLYSAVLYLEAIHSKSPELNNDNLAVIKSYLAGLPKNTFLLKMILDMDGTLIDNPELRFDRLEKAIECGNSSPLILAEAAKILWTEPSLLTKADRTECRILNFMIRHERVTEEVAVRFAKCCMENLSPADGLRLRVLSRLEELSGNDIILEAFCRKLVQLNRRENKWHYAFRKAVEKRLDIPSVFEFYVYTMENFGEEPMDQAVFLYFGYNSYVAEECAEKLFANLVKFKEELRTYYCSFLKNMQQFAFNRLKKGQINQNLAIIYADVIEPDCIDSSLMEVLPDVVFTYRIPVRNSSFKKVVVTNNEESVFSEYEVKDGYADVLMYTDSCTPWFEDSEGNRFLVKEEDKIIRYLHLQDCLTVCHARGAVNPRLAFYMWDRNNRYNMSDEEFISLRKQVVALPTLKKEIKNECCIELANYYYDNYDSTLLESYLTGIDTTGITSKNQSGVIELMMVRDMVEPVMKYVSGHGCESLPLKRIPRFCTHVIETEDEPKYRQEILSMVHYSFRSGIIDERLLKYLADYFNGTTLEMYEIWTAARNMGVDSKKLEENLLAQILFTESYVDNVYAVFLSFYFKNGNRRILRAFICYTAYKYFVKDRVTNPEFFDILKADPSLENSQIGILALLKYYSEKDVLTEEEKNFADSHVRDFLQKKMFFAFFKDFKDKLVLPKVLIDKFYIEYRTNPERTVEIHYAYGEDEELKAEPMNHLGYGIFSKEIILFYGESLQYFITECDGENVEITESNSLIFYEEDHDERATKYDEINNILIAVEMRDEKTVSACLKQYYMTEYAIKRHFLPL